MRHCCRCHSGSLCSGANGSRWRSRALFRCPREILAELIDDRIAAIAAEIPGRNLHAGRGLAALVLGEIEHALDLADRRLVVAAGDHFPTDVIAGALTGAAVGILVPHLHRHESDGRAMWIGLAPMPSGMGVGAHASF